MTLRMIAEFLVYNTLLSAVWCQSDLSVLLPKTLNTTSGSCLLIPCLFNISKEKSGVLQNSAEVTWRRGSLWSIYDTVNFTDSHRQLEPLTELVGDLQQKNCTSVMKNLTSHHSDRYYFRFQAKGFSRTETKAVKITVSDSFPEPTVIMSVLREGEQASLTCTVPAPCPNHSPNVSWDPVLGGNVTHETQLNADGTQSVSAILNFTPSFLHHGLNVSCVSIHPLHREDKPLLSRRTVILNVEYPPKETSISFTGWIWPGNNLTLMCLSNTNPPAVHRWFRQRSGIEEELGNTSQVLSFTATYENSGEYICEAKNQQGGLNSTKLQIDFPGTSFIAFLSFLGFFLLLLIALLLYLICRRRKEHKLCNTQSKVPSSSINASMQETNKTIYINLSETQNPQPKPCEEMDICRITPETYENSTSDETEYFINHVYESIRVKS